MTPLATPLRWHAFAKRFNALPGDYAAIAIRLAWAYASVHVLGNVVRAMISTEVDRPPDLHRVQLVHFPWPLSSG